MKAIAKKDGGEYLKEIVKIRREKLFQEMIAKGKTTDRMNKLFSFSNEWMDGKPMKLYTNIQEIDFKKAKAVSMLSPDMIKSKGNHKI